MKNSRNLNDFGSFLVWVERFELSAPRGEFVLVVEGAPEQQKEESTPEQAADLARCLMADGMSASAAAKEAAAMTGLKKSDIYRLLQQ